MKVVYSQALRRSISGTRFAGEASKRPIRGNKSAAAECCFKMFENARKLKTDFSSSYLKPKRIVFEEFSRHSTALIFQMNKWPRIRRPNGDREASQSEVITAMSGEVRETRRIWTKRTKWDALCRVQGPLLAGKCCYKWVPRVYLSAPIGTQPVPKRSRIAGPWCVLRNRRERDRFEANSASNRERMPIFEPINPSCISSFLFKTFLFNLFRLPSSSWTSASVRDSNLEFSCSLVRNLGVLTERFKRCGTNLRRFWLRGSNVKVQT